jgi:CBS domain-containing protein
MKTVQDILNSKQKVFNSIGPDTLVIDALVQLNSVNLSYLIVMDGDRYKGIFSERDYTRNVILKGRSSNSTTVKEAMTVDLPIVTLSDSAESCIRLMNAHKARYLLVYDNEQRFTGVVTIHDILRLVLSSKEDFFEHSMAGSLLEDDESGRIF